ncbi:beta family protein [Mycobacterium sp. NPDC050853]|uniref:beta family protein n=1 Tax=Mycobacterium sp. NPDC050853 TaxID=3155160 RepID=UPI0033DACB5B
MRGENHYVPILKGRLGEFSALSHMQSEGTPRYTPLIEFVPTGDELDDNGDPRLEAVKTTVTKTRDRLLKNWVDNSDMIVDVHGLPPIPGYFPVVELVEWFFTNHAEAQVIPTCRPTDANDPLLVDLLRNALSEFSDRKVCIRLADEDLDERDEPIAITLDRLLTGLQADPKDVDLVVDFGAINESSVSFASRVARLIIADLPDLDAWKSVTLAAGGFPTDLQDVKPLTITELQRWELVMWRELRDRFTGRRRVPSFGDYGVAYPRQLFSGVAFAPAPQIRYTAPEAWLILKGRRNDRRGFAQFLDICRKITEHAAFTPGLSWGDRQIAEKALFADQDPPPAEARPGNPTTWRAIGTSHHMAYVIDRLTTQGEP